MARCGTCHRRLETGQPCPIHGGEVGAAPRVEPARPAWREPIGECIGAGGFASVWELGGGRVLKVAHAAHELARARIAREAEALGGIGAPTVPGVHGTGVLDDGRAWLAMDRIAGVTLAQVTARGPLPVADAITIATAALGALERVHAAGFVHRDIKPDNLVSSGNAIVIIDLGLARKLPHDPDDPTRANVQVGSLEYIAPEQIEDAASVDARADLYAFACVLYELIAGRPPFVGDAAALERAHIALRAPRLGALASVPAAIEAVVDACLAKAPARRPASAREVRERLLAGREQPSAAGGTHSRSVIREGNQPVVLLWAELPRVDRALLGSLSGRRLAIASQRGRRVLAGVLGADHADPAATAVAAARDLAAAGARVALHLDAIRVDTAGSAPVLHGEPVERPESWLPAQPWTGVVMTRALAAVIQSPTRESAAGPEFRALADEHAAGELIGRDVLLTDLAADAAAALRGQPRPDRSSGAWRATGPAFALLIGDPGVGKSAFAAELARRIGELGARVHLAAIPPPGTGRPGHAALTELIGAPAGPIVRGVGDALRAAARTQPTAVILDDLHLAEHELLDALEYATLGGEQLPLWILGVAGPRLDARRPQLGTRAERRRRDVLAPLDEDDAIALTATLLHPAEYPPLRALRALAQLARGNPLHLVMLAREIHERGAIRPRPGGGHFLDPGALDELQPIALGPWLAARELAHLSIELVALARLCAVLGAGFSRDDLVAVVETIERSGGATTTIDVDVGLRELEAAGIVASGAHGWSFRQSLVEEGIYATTHDDERQAIHRAALEHWRGNDDPAIAERVAWHAEAVGASQDAAAAYVMLGERAVADHRLVDAEYFLTGALRNLGARSLARGRALLDRGRGRYKVQRIRDAIADLEEALAIVVELGAVELEVAVRLEQATALDWADDFAGSREALARARERFDASCTALALDLALAEGREQFRDRAFGEAAKQLREVIAAARVASRHEIEIIAGLLLGPSLVELGELDAAETVFSELIGLCEQRDDRGHIGFAYANRAWLWSAKGLVDRTAEDLRRVIQVARELGQATVERIGTYNLAEDRLWQGDLDTALHLSRRCLSLQRGHGEGTTTFDRMLIARILAARGDRAELASMLASLEADEISADDQVVLDVLRAVATEAPPHRWNEVLAAADRLAPAQRLELALVAAKHGHLASSRRPAVRELAGRDPIWSRRVDEF